MANTLDADPQLAECLEYHRGGEQFVPVARNGEFAALVSHHRLGWFPAEAPLSVGDYVVGLELLGFRFCVEASDDGKGSGLFIMNPVKHIPDAWYRRSLDIAQAYGHRTGDTIDFLIERDGVPA